MRIRLGVLVACILFVVQSSRAEDGKTAMPSDGPASPRVVNDPQPVDPGSPNDRRKNRYISFKPNNIMGATAKLEVTLTGSLPHPGSVGTSWWVQAPVAPGGPLLPDGECVALLGPQATAADIDWVAAGCGILHVTGCPIEPTSDYDVRAVAGAEVSNPLAVPTILLPGAKFWGDCVGAFTGTEWTPPNGVTNINDFNAVYKTWLRGPLVEPDGTRVHLSVADLAPGNINLVVNIDDVYQVVLAVQGATYPYGPADVIGDCSDDPAAAGPNAEIRIVPIRSAPLGSPPSTVGDPVNATINVALGCWEVVVGPGVEVDLDLQAFGWGTAVGSPTLGAIQATVVSAGYSNGVGGDVNPKGWPGSPYDGAYQAVFTCQVGGDASPCSSPFDPTCAGGANGSCDPNPDWVMPACAWDFPSIVTSTLDYAWATAAQINCAIDDGLVKTMGGLILEVPFDAAGTYLIELNPDPNSSFMTTGAGTPITGITLTPACITVIPPCCLPDGSCTLLTTTECAMGGGIRACECRGDDDMNGVDDGCEADCDGDGILDILELADCTPGDLSCNDCNLNCIPDECDIDPSDPDGNGEVSGDNDGDGVPSECDNCPDIPNPGQEDRNGDGVGDACSGACCFVLNGNFSCLDTSDAECAVLPGVTGVFQGFATVCPTEGVGTQTHLGTVVTHVTNPAQLCGGGGGRGTCNPGDPIDPWQTALDADICHQFGVGPESPAIPADFFGPGSDPFTGQVCLKGDPLGLTPFGEFGDADTLVKRTGGPAGTGDPFDRCELPSANEVTVNAEVVALSLQSIAPIIVTFNGGQNPESWDVVVGLSTVTPLPGTITAVKTHCNGGTYNSELHVQPRFTFTEVDDPNNIEVLDTGLAGIPFVTLTQDTDPHWTSDVSETLGLPSSICTDFHPGIEDTEPTADCDCNDNQVRDLCDIESPSLALPPHDILKNRYISIDPRGAGLLNVCLDFDIKVTLTGSLVNGQQGNGPWWAGPPDAQCLSVVVQTQPVVPTNWDACPTLHLTGCPIIPTSDYDIAVVSGGTESAPPLAATTQAKPGRKWHGDVVGSFDGVVWSPPNGVVNASDIQAVIKTFVKAPGAAHVSVTDVHPNLDGIPNNRLVNANDILVVIFGFLTLEYPEPDLTLCP